MWEQHKLHQGPTHYLKKLQIRHLEKHLVDQKLPRAQSELLFVLSYVSLFGCLEQQGSDKITKSRFLHNYRILGDRQIVNGQIMRAILVSDLYHYSLKNLLRKRFK